MKRTPTLTLEVRKILRVMLLRPTAEYYGLELARAAGLPEGSIYPILARLERADWLQSAWEDIDPKKEKRRARRYYRLTSKGSAAARSAVAEMQVFFGAVRTNEGG